MKTPGFSFIGIGAAVLLAFSWCASASAQSGPETRKPPATPPESAQSGGMQTAKAPEPMMVPLAVGTAFNATLLTELDARRNRAGDGFTAEISEPVRYQRSVIFPKGTLLMGHLVRASAAGRGRRGSGLFLQFEKAVLKSGDAAALCAGIQAIAVTTGDGSEKALPEDAESAEFAEPIEDVSNAREEEAVRETSAKRVLETSRTHVTKPKSDLLDPAKLETPLTQGSFTKQGLFTPDSQGVFGMPDVKLYTPLSQGSNGSVLLSTRKNLRVSAGTKLLLVIQPPAAALPLENK